MAKTKDKIKKLFKPFKKLKKVFSNSSSKSDVSSAIDVEKSFYNNPNEQRGVMEEHIDNKQRMHFDRELEEPLVVPQVSFEETSSGALSESSESNFINYRSLEELLPPPPKPPHELLKSLLYGMGVEPGPKFAPGEAQEKLRELIEETKTDEYGILYDEHIDSNTNNRIFENNSLTSHGMSFLDNENYTMDIIPGFTIGDFSTPGQKLYVSNPKEKPTPIINVKEQRNNELGQNHINKADPSTLNKVPKRK